MALCMCMHVCFDDGIEKREGGVQRALSFSFNSQHTQERGKLQKGYKKTWEVGYKLRPNTKIYIRPPGLKPTRK